MSEYVVVKPGYLDSDGDGTEFYIGPFRTRQGAHRWGQANLEEYYLLELLSPSHPQTLAVLGRKE